MKKKIIGSLLALTALVAVISPSQSADAQVIYSNRCCDGAGNIHCVLQNGSFPLGTSCFCYGQGYGFVC